MMKKGHKLLALILTLFFTMIFLFLGKGLFKTENPFPGSIPENEGSTSDNMASKILARHPGTRALALAVIREGRIIDSQFAGVMGDGSRGRVCSQTLFIACSLSKPVFAYLVLKMVDRGVFGLDQSLLATVRKKADLLRDYRDVAADPRLKLLTARIILSHRSGFPNWRSQEPDRRLRFKFDPASSFSYSGEGYRFLQAILESLSGRNLDELSAEVLFTPLKMRDSFFLLDRSMQNKLSFDIETIPAFFRKELFRRQSAAGSLICTIGDYARFLEAVIAGDGLSEEMHSEMLNPFVKMTAKALFGPQANEPGGWVDGEEPYWCLGWIYFRSLLGESYFHLGNDPGFENFAVFFPKLRAGLVILASGPSPYGVARDAVESFFGDTGIPFAWMGL
ncbi:MAG: serine hydrolase domain-containing protein [Candidatus Aminicenantaceae bacterium]